MKRVDINAALQREVVSGAVAMHRYEGAKRMFDAACLDGDGQRADLHRQELHAILDIVLDGTASTMMLTRQMIQSKE